MDGLLEVDLICPTKVDRIDYSNDTSTASPKGPLSVAVYGQASTEVNLMDIFVVVFLLVQE